MENKKYYYHVVYEPGFVNYTGSNSDEFFYWELEPKKIMEVPNRKVVTWELNDLPLTKKFIECYKQKIYAITYDQLVRGRKSSWRMIADVYKGLTTTDVLASRAEMNCIIEWLNTDFQENIWFKIPSKLKLNEVDIYDKREKNLNELHDHFETRMVELESKVARGEIEDESMHKILWDKLQSINLLVHYNERLGVENEIDMMDDADPTYFTSLKCDSPARTEWLLEPEDYEHFTMIRSSNALTLDFGTVGKDLFTCSVTDDQELVYKNMISQQWELNPWVQFDFTSCSEEEWEDDQMEVYNKWLEEHKISDYLDLSDPKYTPGRHQLGECISHNFTSGKDFIDQVISDTPKIHGFFITDEDNNSIL